MSFATRILRFYSALRPPPMPRGVEVMNPYTSREARTMARAFLDKYFSDERKRTLVFGINPGRFGAGITGVTFTDPVALTDFCGIPNALPRKRELSSVFIYRFIERFGGSDAFYHDFFLTAMSPLGYTRDGKNLNYYDVPELARRTTPFIEASIERQIRIGGYTGAAIVLGKGKNFEFMQKLNDRKGYFERLLPLEHPRPIMQYRLKKIDSYLDEYVRVFHEARKLQRA